MKYDGDENYFFKRTIQAYMNRNEQFSRWIWEVRYWETYWNYCDSGNRNKQVKKALNYAMRIII
jgi:hypothetical protein